MPKRCRADVADPVEGRRLLDTAVERHGRLDLWVNNAGVAPERRLDLLETTPESWDRVVATNLKGPFFLTQAVANAMIGQLAAGKAEQPQIVFISSISSVFASVNRAEYCVAKAGLSMAAQLFAVRLAGQGIRVYEIRPGLIETEMTRPVHDLVLGQDRGGAHADSPLGNARGRRPRRGGDRRRRVSLFHRGDSVRRRRIESAGALI